MRKVYLTAAFLLVTAALLLPAGVDGEADLDPSGLEYSDNIVLEGDLALESKVLLEEWSGNGTSEDPYIIEGYILETTGQGIALYLDNISKHLVIRDCIIKDDNDIFFTNQRGNAYIMDSSNIDFVNCVFESGTMQALRIDRSQNCSIINCTFRIALNDAGTTFTECDDIMLQNNSLTGPDSVGMKIENCLRLQITNNTFDKIGYGFEMLGSVDVRIAHNSMFNTTNANLYGIYNFNISITDNIFDRSDYYSIWMYYVEDCRIERNEFTRTSFGFMGYTISNTSFKDNYLDCGHISIALEGFENITMSGNRMWNSSIHLLDGTDDFRTLNITKNNQVNDKPLIFIKDSDLKGENIDTDVGQILLVNVSNARILDLNIKNTFSPIGLIGCENVTVRDCDLDQNSGILYARSCNRLEVEGLTARQLENGLHFEKVTNSTITGNYITSTFNPIALISSSHNSVINNEFTSHSGTTRIRFSDDNVVIGNIFHSGLSIGFSYRNTIEDNRFDKYGLIFPDNLLWDPEQPEPRNNIVNGMRQDYILNRIEEDIEIPEDSEHLILFNLTRCSIPEYEIVGGEGVKIVECSDLTLSGWKLDSCRSGIRITRSFRVNVIDCMIEGDIPGEGITMHESIACRLEGNHIKDMFNGIMLDNCLGPEVYHNTIEGIEGDGIEVYNQTREFLIIRNYVNGSLLNGILLGQSWEGLISGNRVVHNDDYGIYCGWSSRMNLIYNNHFSGNHGSLEKYERRTRQGNDGGTDNAWYYEAPDVTIGNYWADMQGPDDNDDGIADPEYYLDGTQGSYDLYPMIADHEPQDKIAGMKIGEIWLTFILIGIIIGVVFLVAWKAMDPKYE